MKSSSASSSCQAPVMKSRSGQRKTIRTRRIGLDPMKSRSGTRCGKKKSGCQRLEEHNFKKNGKQFQKVTWAKKAKENVQKSNKASYVKRVVKISSQEFSICSQLYYHRIYCKKLSRLSLRDAALLHVRAVRAVRTHPPH